MSDFNFRNNFRNDEAFALERDQSDPLWSYRGRFFFPKIAGRECTYLCGHSLGLQPKTVSAFIEQDLKAWAELGVEGHFHAQHPWIPYHRFLTEQLSELVGAKPIEVVAMNSLTVNLHLMMVSFYRPTRQRYKIVIERGAFPSDQYAVQSQIRYHGFDPATALIELTPLPGEACLREDEIEQLISRSGKEIALIMLGGVNYATGQAFDLERITRAGHAQGCVVGFDLAHAAGNLPMKLHDWGPDFAVWCSYKYLNGGPGCIAGCFVHERHAKAWELPRFAGWWGHDEKSRFAMDSVFQPMPGAEGWQLSNPAIFSLGALRASLEIFHDAGMAALRKKSIELTAYLEYLLDQNPNSKFSVLTPRESHRRGAQISIRVPQQNKSLCDRLLARGIVADWREPDILRVAPIPLYNSFSDVYRFVKGFISTII